MDAKTFEVTRSEEEWRRLLTPEQYAVMRGHGTERPGSCALNFEKRAGAFSCAGCGQPLFVSKTKFESGTGWPSFNRAGRGFDRNLRGPDLRNGPHRGALQPMRQPSRPRLRRRPAADAPALLHQRRGHELPSRVTPRQRTCRAGRALHARRPSNKRTPVRWIGVRYFVALLPEPSSDSDVHVSPVLAATRC